MEKLNGTNGGKDSFTNGTDSVDAGEAETPPNDMTDNSMGKVTDVVENNKPNRFFNENAQEIKSNDSATDKIYLDGKYKVGDQLFIPISISTMFSFLAKAGIMPPAGLGLGSRYGETALGSHNAADFGSNQLMAAYSETHAYTEYGGGTGIGAFYRFRSENIMYDLGDRLFLPSVFQLDFILYYLFQLSGWLLKLDL